MTHKEIIKNNVLIAEFMGYQNIKGPKEYPVYKIPQHAYEINEEGNTVTIDTFEANWDLCFHSSWDWLMPVVEKIETTAWKFPVSLNELTIKRNLTEANVFMFQSFDPRSKFTGWTVFLELEGTGLRFGTYERSKTKIEAVYNAVVQFIEWYNTQNK